MKESIYGFIIEILNRDLAIKTKISEEADPSIINNYCKNCPLLTSGECKPTEITIDINGLQCVSIIPQPSQGISTINIPSENNKTIDINIPELAKDIFNKNPPYANLPLAA